MKWLKKSPKQFAPDQLVRLVTTNDERSMLLTTSPFIARRAQEGVQIRFRPFDQRRLVPIDPEEEGQRTQPIMEGPAGKPSTANNLRWPRPIIIPAHLVPRDFDDADEEKPSNFGQKFAQQSAESFFPVAINEAEADRFHSQLWSKPTYRMRCYVWSLWQKHLKDWWFFIRYPLAFGAALGYAIATIVHLARSHPTP